jgi:hypothetical protein
MTFLADSDVALVLDRPKTIRISREGSGCYSAFCDGGWSHFPTTPAACLNKNLDKTTAEDVATRR